MSANQELIYVVLALLGFALASTLLAVSLGLTFAPISIWAVHRRAKTWIGINYQSARARLHGAKLTDETWMYDAFSGHTLVATYKHCTVRLNFGKDEKVILATVVIDS